MKFLSPLSSVLLNSLVFASPTKIDVKIHVDVPDTIDHRVNNVAIRPLADPTTSSSLPKVTLDYEVHQASPDQKKDQTYYAFENIPYARQPVGDLRFKEAQKIEGYTTNPPLNDGSKTVVCPQVQVGWFPFASEWSSQLFNLTANLDPKFEKPITPDQYKPLAEVTPIPNQSEECLVLDVFTPKRLYDDENIPLKPVIVSFHGGGFIFGSKTIFGSPEGILKTAGENGVKDDVVIVTINYRLGAFGWLGGREFREGGGFENAGLSDQKVALDWVYENINRFGGDPYAVTVMGESAGASSILHHLTAYGFDRSRPPSYPRFQSAIIQSPAYFPQTSQWQMNATYRALLKSAKVKSFKELQNVKTEDLIKANAETVYYSPYGTFTYGPVVSDDRQRTTYVQVPPTLKLQTGVWFSHIPLMIANNRREGSIFTPPWLRKANLVEAHIRGLYPKMTNESLEEFTKLYPMPPKDESGREKTEREKFLDGAAAFGDLGTDCNVWALQKAASNSQTYQYFYRIYPGFHGQDVGATWYPEAGKDLTDLNVKAQSERLQRWITCFARYEANPNCNKKPLDADFKPLGDKSSAMWIGSGVPVPGDDQVHFMSDLPGGMPSKDICSFWNSAPYWEPDEPDAELTRFLQVQNGWMTEL